jgi:hypothetical protein
LIFVGADVVVGWRGCSAARLAVLLDEAAHAMLHGRLDAHEPDVTG